jgi:hypothetical protein
MNDTTTCPARDDATRSRLAVSSHAQVYHVRCGQCGASTVFDLATDAVRMICPTCNVRLTLPATVDALCASCHTLVTYPHTLAGHSTSCGACGRAVMLEAVIGSAERRRHRHRRHHRHHRRPRGRNDRTLAFSEGAERSLILIAAAIATLVFVVAVGMHQIL